MALSDKKWWSLSKHEARGIIAILFLICLCSIVLIAIRGRKAEPLTVAQQAEVKAFASQVDKVILDDNTTPHRHDDSTKVSHKKAKRQKTKATTSSSKTTATQKQNSLEKVTNINQSKPRD